MKDCISRAALLAAYDAEHVGPPGRGRELIANAPALDAKPVIHAHWIERWVDDDPIDKNGIFRHRFYCSACGEYQTYGDTDFCPMCGAKMDEDGDSV